MKLIIQIPCLNEEATLPATLKDLPRKIEGIDEIEVLVIDDGSTDRTSEVARAHNADHVVRLTSNQGLAKAFMVGLDTALALGADIIVNTDADNQYCSSNIPDLVQPILAGSADFVIGTRNFAAREDFSPLKKFLQRLGSRVVSRFSQIQIPDATSGFRALSRAAALQLNVFSQFTYTLESIIQAGKKNIALAHVPIQSSPSTRKSRLFSSNWDYCRRSAGTIIKIYIMYEPLRTFFSIGAIVFGAGMLLALRFLYFFFTIPGPTGHVQSLVVSAVLLLFGFLIFTLGIISDLISSNRKLTEDLTTMVKRVILRPSDPGSPVGHQQSGQEGFRHAVDDSSTPDA